MPARKILANPVRYSANLDASDVEWLREEAGFRKTSMNALMRLGIVLLKGAFKAGIPLESIENCRMEEKPQGEEE